MKPQTLLRLVAFFATVFVSFLVADRAIGLVLDRILVQSQIRFSQVYQGNAASDLVILGNSRAVNAFYAPRIDEATDQKVFHLGYNGMSMLVAEALYLDYVENNGAPKVLILEVTNLNDSHDLISDLKPYVGRSERLTRLLRTEETTIYWATRLSHLYRYNSELFQRALFYLRKDDQSWINNRTLDIDAINSMVPTDRQQKSNMLRMDNDNAEALLRIIKQCQLKDTSVRLIVSPYLPTYIDNVHSYSDWLDHFRASLPDTVQLFDFSKALESPEYFADQLHANKEGSLKLFDIMLAEKVFSSPF